MEFFSVVTNHRVCYVTENQMTKLQRICFYAKKKKKRRKHTNIINDRTKRNKTQIQIKLMKKTQTMLKIYLGKVFTVTYLNQ